LIGLKKYALPSLFFLIVFIASCITFNNNQVVEKYDYDTSIYADDINAFNGFTIHEAKNALIKQNQFVLLFKENKLTYLLSNNPLHHFSYNYNELENGMHLLYNETKNRFERGGNLSIIKDSILCYKNIVLKKYKIVGSRFSRSCSYLIFKKENTSVQQFTFRDTTSDAFSAKAIVTTFANGNEKKSFPDFKETKIIPITTELMERQFFKNYILPTGTWIK
jgi:hypothetical protein